MIEDYPGRPARYPFFPPVDRVIFIVAQEREELERYIDMMVQTERVPRDQMIQARAEWEFNQIQETLNFRVRAMGRLRLKILATMSQEIIDEKFLRCN